MKQIDLDNFLNTNGTEHFSIVVLTLSQFQFKNKQTNQSIQIIQKIVWACKK